MLASAYSSSRRKQRPGARAHVRADSVLVGVHRRVLYDSRSGLLRHRRGRQHEHHRPSHTPGQRADLRVRRSTRLPHSLVRPGCQGIATRQSAGTTVHSVSIRQHYPTLTTHFVRLQRQRSPYVRPSDSHMTPPSVHRRFRSVNPASWLLPRSRESNTLRTAFPSRILVDCDLTSHCADPLRSDEYFAVDLRGARCYHKIGG